MGRIARVVVVTSLAGALAAGSSAHLATELRAQWCAARVLAAVRASPTERDRAHRVTARVLGRKLAWLDEPMLFIGDLRELAADVHEALGRLAVP